MESNESGHFRRLFGIMYTFKTVSPGGRLFHQLTIHSCRFNYNVNGSRYASLLLRDYDCKYYVFSVIFACHYKFIPGDCLWKVSLHLAFFVNKLFWVEKAACLYIKKETMLICWSRNFYNQKNDYYFFEHNFLQYFKKSK